MDRFRTTPPLAPPLDEAVRNDDQQRHRRAYDLYEERGSEQGHDVDDDWVQAERELREAVNSMEPQNRPPFRKGIVSLPESDSFVFHCLTFELPSNIVLSHQRIGFRLTPERVVS